MKLFSIFSGADKKGLDMSGWKNTNFSREDRVLAERPVEVILQTAKHGGTEEEYKADTRSLSWKASYYASHLDDPDKVQDTLDQLEHFFPESPVRAISEYESAFFDLAVRVNEQSEPNVFQAKSRLGKSFVEFLKKAAENFPDSHHAVQSKAEQYSEECYRGEGLFDDEDLEALEGLSKELPEGPLFVTDLTVSPPITSEIKPGN
jgi:hypothetical protein